MHKHPQTIQGIPRQPEADHQHFKGHTIVDVAEGRAIKIKPHRLFRAIVAILKPEKLRIWSIKRRISQALASLSIHGRRRVAQILL